MIKLTQEREITPYGAPEWLGLGSSQCLEHRGGPLDFQA